MKRIILCILLGMITTSCSPKKEKSDAFTLQRGINVSHWLSQVYSEEPERTRYFNELDVIFLKSAGFDHIRLPIDEERLWTLEGKRIEKTWAELHNAIRWCDRHGLRVIVDLHVVRSHHFNAEFDGAKNTLFTDPEALAHFLDLWSQLSTELKHYPNSLVAYEILNEASAPRAEDWNHLVQKTVAQLRESEPERTLVIGSNNWQIPETFPDLEIPANDPNLILSFHLYSPLPFTHYKASWTPFHEYDGPIQYPGKPVDEAHLTGTYSQAFLDKLSSMNTTYTSKTQADRIQIPLQVALKQGLPLYCGEFGCLPTVPREMRLQWYRDAIQIMSSNQIGYAAWDYKGGFAIVGRDTGSIDWDLTHILTENTGR